MIRSIEPGSGIAARVSARRVIDEKLPSNEDWSTVLYVCQVTLES